jgi:hypothetical protein
MDVPLISRLPAPSAPRLFGGGSLRHAFVAVLLVAPLAHAQVVDIAWDAQGKFKRELHADPGKFVELCGKLRSGAKVEWRFDGDGLTNFNIHYHEGNSVQFPSREDGVRTSKGTLGVKSDQDYCWMWSNKTPAPVSVRVELIKAP